MRRSPTFTLVLMLIVTGLIGVLTIRAHAEQQQPQDQREPQSGPQSQSPDDKPIVSTRPVLLASSIEQSGSRAWAVYRNSQGEHLLVLIAPRESSSSAMYDAAPSGQVQAMRPLGNRLPIAIAAKNESVYLVYPSVYANDRRLMRVYSSSAFPSPLGGLWTVDPPTRLRSEQPIELDAQLLDLQATDDTLYALLVDADSTHHLMRLDPGAWTRLAMPEGLNTKRLDMVAIADRIVLVDRAGTSFNATMYDPQSQQWQPLPDALPLGKHTQLLSGQRAITAIDWDDNALARLRTWSPAGLFTLADGLELPSDARYAVLDSSSTLLGLRVIEQDPGSIEPGAAAEEIELTELDLLDSTLRYRGPPLASTPVSADEFRFLVGMMMLVMVGVLVVVILPDRSDAMQLPEGFAIADPGRRLIATMLDVVLVASIVGRFFDLSASEILTLSVIIRPDNAWAVIPATIIAGVLYATLSEWLMGATPAKLIVGLRVVRAQAGPSERPKLWSALVRNIVKWVLPPVAALALVDPEAMHRGDRASRSLVVVPLREDPTPSEPDL